MLCTRATEDAARRMRRSGEWRGPRTGDRMRDRRRQGPAPLTSSPPERFQQCLICRGYRRQVQQLREGRFEMRRRLGVVALPPTLAAVSRGAVGASGGGGPSGPSVGAAQRKPFEQHDLVRAALLAAGPDPTGPQQLHVVVAGVADRGPLHKGRVVEPDDRPRRGGQQAKPPGARDRRRQSGVRAGGDRLAAGAMWPRTCVEQSTRGKTNQRGPRPGRRPA